MLYMGVRTREDIPCPEELGAWVSSRALHVNVAFSHDRAQLALVQLDFSRRVLVGVDATCAAATQLAALVGRDAAFLSEAVDHAAARVYIHGNSAFCSHVLKALSAAVGASGLARALREGRLRVTTELPAAKKQAV
jgi:hypothetical protein